MRANLKNPVAWSALACCASLALPPAGAAAQTQGERILAAASQARDLDLPKAPSPLPEVPRMGLFKPDGAGPFPALVLHHQCAGLGRGKLPNASMLDTVPVPVSLPPRLTATALVSVVSAISVALLATVVPPE